MMNHQNRADTTVRSKNFVLTAAVLAMLAGAPAGFAQSDADESAPKGGLGSFMNLLGGAEPEAAQPGADEEFRTDGVFYDDSMTVELHVQDEELTDVLQMLSLQSERNIVANSEVSARITANLYGVTFYEALEAILHVNGYGYIEKGNFIYVYPAETLIQIQDAARQPEGHVFHLSFLSAVDAADFVTPLLSEGGEIKSNGKVSGWTDPTTPTGNEEFASESTLIVYDFPENIEAIGKMLGELDTRPAQILVEATIVQTSLNEANAFGVDFSIIADFDYADFANPLGAVDALVKGTDGSGRVPSDGGASAIVGTPGNISGPGTFKAGIVSNDVTVFLRMLNEVTSTTIISNPKVVTLNRQPGRVLVGRKVGYLQTTATQTSTTQSVEFLDTGTQLNFRPFTNGDGIIRMELKPQVSEAQLRSATDATGAAVTIPDEVTNELTANVMVPDGHTIVLGGLFREATTATRRQVPVLGDIPILGTAFRGHDDDVQRQEIIFMITPSIVSDQVLVSQGLRAEESVRQVRAGAREGTLPFGQTRQAAQWLVEAEQLAKAGKTDKALHKLRQVLHVEPQNVQAIALRERLVNKLDNWPSNSLLEGIINGAAENQTEHNILQHGWRGDISQAEPVSDDHHAVASDHPARQQNFSNADARRQSFNGRTGNSDTQTAGHPGNPSNGGRGYANNSRNFGDAIQTPEYDASNWWTTPEFDVFMVTWAAASAMERNEEFDPTNRWWTSDQFRDFFGSYQTAQAHGSDEQWQQSPEFQQFLNVWSHAAAQEQHAAGANPADAWWQSPEFAQFMATWANAAAQEQSAGTDPADAWWQSPEFAQFMATWADAAAQEQFAAAHPTDNWWQSPEFGQFMAGWAQAAATEQNRYAEAAEWWKSAEFREFMAAFNNAVEKADALDAAEGGHDNSGRNTPSDAGYTNVPGDNED